MPWCAIARLPLPRVWPFVNSAKTYVILLLAATTLGLLTPGAAVNVEVDVLAKYVERLLTVEGAR